MMLYSYHSIGLHSEAFISQSHANLRIAFSASLLVAVSFSAKYFSNCAGMVSGGPPSIMALTFVVSPTDLNAESRRTRDRAT